MTAANNELMRLEQERKMGMQVQNLLERTVGEEKFVRRSIWKWISDQIVTKEEIYDPDTQVVRSQATITEEGLTTAVKIR